LLAVGQVNHLTPPQPNFGVMEVSSASTALTSALAKRDDLIHMEMSLKVRRIRKSDPPEFMKSVYADPICYQFPQGSII